MILLTNSMWANNLVDAMLEMKHKNYTMAIKMFEQLAHKGNHIAQQNLGVMYNQGLGVKRDNMRAAYWFNVATQDVLPYEFVASN